MSETETPNSKPDRTDVLVDTHAIHVRDLHIHVWQYRLRLSDSDGEWTHVETLRRDDDPKLSVEQATMSPPSADGYWIYCKRYDCTLGCE